MLLPPSCLSPFAMPSVCHLLSHFSDLFMKYVCTTPLCNGCRRAFELWPDLFPLPLCWICQVRQLPIGIWWGISGLVLNLRGVGFKPGLCREFSGSGKAGHCSSVSLGCWDLSVQVLAGGGVGFGLQRLLAGVQLSQRGTLFTKLWTVISLSQKCLAWRGALRLCHESRFPSPHLSVGGSSQLPPVVGVLVFLTFKD